jgi:putative transposase
MNGSEHTSFTAFRGEGYATKWLWTYNNDRPNMGIGSITPAMKLNHYKMVA